jgi:hypothetical protein
MCQNSVDDVHVFNAGDHPYGSATAAAYLDVDAEYDFEALGPGHGGMRPGVRTVCRNSWYIRSSTIPGQTADVVEMRAGVLSSV